MLRWIFWIIIAFWLISRLKFLFNNQDEKNHSDIKPDNTQNKHLKKDAGDYVDYEELH